MNLFLGGDSGYGIHFKEIGAKYGPFDWAILECGQYNHKWLYIHSLPAELILESQDLRAKKLIPVHHSKFKLAEHSWYEPLEQVSDCAVKAGIPLFTPQIGEVLNLDTSAVNTTHCWWKTLVRKSK